MLLAPRGGAQGGIWAGNTLLWAGAAGPLARVRVCWMAAANAMAARVALGILLNMVEEPAFPCFI